MPTVAIIGCGYWGPNLLRNFSEDSRVNVKYVCDKRPDRLEALRRRYPAVKYTDNFDEVLADPNLDGVVIATPANTHCPLALRAFEFGKHVLVEKPMATNIEDCRTMIDAARDAGKILMVDHTFLFHPAVQRMKQVMENEPMGKPLYFNASRVNLGIFQPDVNVIWDLALHDITIMDYLLARTPRSIMAAGASHTPHGIEDIAWVTMLFDDNLIANVHVSWLSPVKMRQITIGCQQKMMVFNDLITSEKLRIYDKGINFVEPLTDEEKFHTMITYRIGDMYAPALDLTEPLRLMTSHFVDCMVEGIRPLTSGEDGLRIVTLVNEADRAAKTGLTVR